MILKVVTSPQKHFKLIERNSKNFSTKLRKVFRPINKKKTSGAILIDGKSIANSVKATLANEVESFQRNSKSSRIRPPKLGYILVGKRADSELYVKMKKKVCSQLGISTTGKHFMENVTQEEIMEYIHYLNADDTVDGILTQLPMPEHVEETAIYDVISHTKDVDGIHPFNMAAMARHEEPLFTPCTPKGVMRLIQSVCPDIKGKKATVIGRSNIVGMPISMLLQKEFATVTLCHAFTENLREEV